MVSTNDVATAEHRGLRKAMMALNDIKMAWALNELWSWIHNLKSKLNDKKRQFVRELAWIFPVFRTFKPIYNDFNSNGNGLGFCMEPLKRIIQKFGSSEAIYEPPQHPDPKAAEGFEQLEDPLEETVAQMAQLCGLRKVGWIFGHAPREAV